MLLGTMLGERREYFGDGVSRCVTVCQGGSRWVKVCQGVSRCVKGVSKVDLAQLWLLIFGAQVLIRQVQLQRRIPAGA